MYGKYYRKIFLFFNSHVNHPLILCRVVSMCSRMIEKSKGIGLLLRNNNFAILQQTWVKNLSLVFIYLSSDNLETARLTVFCIFLLLMKISVISCSLWALFYSAQHYFRLMVDTTQHLIFPVFDNTFSFSNKYWNWPAVIELGSTAGWGEVF